MNDPCETFIACEQQPTERKHSCSLPVLARRFLPAVITTNNLPAVVTTDNLPAIVKSHLPVRRRKSNISASGQG